MTVLTKGTNGMNTQMEHPGSMFDCDIVSKHIHPGCTLDFNIASKHILFNPNKK